MWCYGILACVTVYTKIVNFVQLLFQIIDHIVAIFADVVSHESARSKTIRMLSTWVRVSLLSRAPTPRIVTTFSPHLFALNAWFSPFFSPAATRLTSTLCCLLVSFTHAVFLFSCYRSIPWRCFISLGWLLLNSDKRRPLNAYSIVGDSDCDLSYKIVQQQKSSMQ